MGSIYGKYLIDQYAIPISSAEAHEKERVLRTHSLRRLMNYINEKMDIEIPLETEDSILRADGYYYTTRYPGDDSFRASERDIEKAWFAINDARQFTYNVIQEIEQEHPIVGAGNDEIER